MNCAFRVWTALLTASEAGWTAVIDPSLLPALRGEAGFPGGWNLMGWRLRRQSPE